VQAGAHTGPHGCLRVRRDTLRHQAATAGLALAAILVIWLVYFGPVKSASVSTVLTGLSGLWVVLLAARYPDRSLIALIIVLPFQGFLLARLWAWGFPTSIVRHLSAWKEAVAVGVVLAGARHYLATGRRADALDRVALGFVGLVLLYLAAQATIIPSAPSQLSVRLLGFRQDAGFVLLALGARHAPLPADFLRRAGRAVLASAVLVAGVCAFETVATSTWNHFVVYTIRYTRYELDLLHANPPNVFDIRVYGLIGGLRVVRAGSIFLSALTCGFYLVIGFAVGLERATRGGGPRWTIPAVVLIGAGILLTQTRSAILAALVVAFLAFAPGSSRQRAWRTQSTILICLLLILAVPAALSTGLASRITGATNNNDHSSAAHVSAFWNGLHTIEHHPLGLGLGTSAGVGQRASSDATEVVVPENGYLQVGIELGVIGMLSFVALTLVLLWRLRAAAHSRPDPLLAASWGALAGLAVATWLLQTWVDFSVAWTAWGLAGGSLAAARAGVTDHSAERLRGTARHRHHEPVAA
jgi:O-antigen ligase/polysaccharide polymerase Wzy-like membrane protein